MTASSATMYEDSQLKSEANRFAETQKMFSKTGERVYERKVRLRIPMLTPFDPEKKLYRPKMKLEEYMEKMRLYHSKMEMLVTLQCEYMRVREHIPYENCLTLLYHQKSFQIFFESR